LTKYSLSLENIAALHPFNVNPEKEILFFRKFFPLSLSLTLQIATWRGL